MANVEKEILPPLKGAGTNELDIEPPSKTMKAKSNHVVAIGGIVAMLAITAACLYIFVFDETSSSHGDAVKLIYLIAGGIMGSLYASFTQERRGD
jgi:hypothetical protein